MRFSAALFLSLGCFTAVASAEDGNCTRKDSSTRPDCPGAIRFFHEFQSALKNNDRKAVASLISYPVLIAGPRGERHIRNSAQLLAHFDAIFDDEIRCAILSATDKDVWGNWRGFTVDGGPIWFDAIIPAGAHPNPKDLDYWTRYPMKIITINNRSDYSCRKVK